ncbi:hypothetical protein DL96DRAFT_1818741 [Flagelloscypha sp. PMI_526]|nr:hypothetical protein DL96DRAFT_1818741 [Flagelloscypha sp. PMI_526]
MVFHTYKLFITLVCYILPTLVAAGIRSGGTNAKRLSRGLPPASPRRLYGSRTSTARRSQASSGVNYFPPGNFQDLSGWTHDLTQGTDVWTWGYDFCHLSDAGMYPSESPERKGTTYVSHIISGLTKDVKYRVSYYARTSPYSRGEGTAGGCSLSMTVGDQDVTSSDGHISISGDGAFQTDWRIFNGVFTASSSDSVAFTALMTCTDGYTNQFILDDITVTLY